MSKNEDPLLESLLEEVLGGRCPPDRTDKILAAHAERTTASEAGVEDVVAPPPFAEPTPQGPVVHLYTTLQPQRRMAAWPFGAAALVVAGVLLVWRFQATQTPDEPQSLAHAPVSLESEPVSPPNKPTALSPTTQPPAVRSVGRLNHRATSETDSPAAEKAAEDRSNGLGEPPSFSKPSSVKIASSPKRRRAAPQNDATIIAAVNNALATAWKENDIAPARRASNGEWLRRVFLRVLGRIPSVEEHQRFVNAGPEQTVDALLFEEQYIEQFAQNWTSLWTNVLVGRSGGMHPNDLGSREGLQQFLRRAFQHNRPFDEVTYDLLSAAGSGRPSSSAPPSEGSPATDLSPNAYNGAANFMLISMNERNELITSRTTSVFLGRQLQCVKCHNHPFNEWKQHQYWELNAFFRQMQTVVDAESGIVRLEDHDFLGESLHPEEADVFYEQLDGLQRVAYPVFFTGEAIEPSGRIEEVRRRERLGRFVADSEELPQAVVNRLWAHFFGCGFTKPVDDMGPHNPPSHPGLLLHLSEQFAAHAFDFKRLIRWIVLSDAFSRSSEITARNEKDAPQRGQTPLFSRYYMRQMQPEELYDSLYTAAQAPRPAGGYPAWEREKLAWLEQFTYDLQTDEGDEITLFDGAAPQALMMMNGSLMRKMTSVEASSQLTNAIRSSGRFEQKVEQLYLAALTRPPHRAERSSAQQLLVAQRGNTATALQDLWWALLNSNEFILDH